MLLNHFTSEMHLGLILRCGLLVTTESNIGSPVPEWPPTGEHVGPDVVWFTLQDEPSDVGLDSARATIPKGGVRMVCDVPDADCRHWPEWARGYGIHPDWYRHVGRAAGQESNPDTWWVVERAVPWTEWVRIESSSPVTVGSRNAPCYCGSGRKFKTCHLGRPRPYWTGEPIVPTLLPEEATVLKNRLTLDRRTGEIRVPDGEVLFRFPGGVPGNSTDGHNSGSHQRR